MHYACAWRFGVLQADAAGLRGWKTGLGLVGQRTPRLQSDPGGAFDDERLVLGLLQTEKRQVQRLERPGELRQEKRLWDRSQLKRQRYAPGAAQGLE